MGRKNFKHRLLETMNKIQDDHDSDLKHALSQKEAKYKEEIAELLEQN